MSAQTTPADAPAAHDPYARKWWVLAAVCVALFMALLDGSVVNVAIPSIAEGLDATFSQVEWVLNAYTLVFASLLITFGRLGDMFGRKRFFITGLIVFGVGSLLCGLSTSPEMLIASRIVQAMGAACMMPATLSLTAVNFPPEQRGMAMGIWGAVVGVATAVGPSLGGWITEGLSWNYIFFINLPIVILGVPFALWAIPESRDEREHVIDWFGALLSMGMLASLSYGLIEGPTLGWTDQEIIGLFALAAILLVTFIFWERRAREPIMDLNLFRNRAFTAGNLSGGILMFGMMGMFFLLPIYMQAQLGYSAVTTGFALTPLSAAILISAPLSGRLSDRVGSRWLVFAGMLTAAAAVFWLSFMPLGAGWQWLVAPLFVAGLGMGLVMSPMTSAVMAAAPQGEEGAASGILSTMRQIGGVFGVAVLGAVFQTAMLSSLSAAVYEVPKLPAPTAHAIATVIEESGGGMGSMMSGTDMSSMRSKIPTAALLPLVKEVVTESASENLPKPFDRTVADAVITKVEDGVAIDDRASLQAALSELMAPSGGGSHGQGGSGPATGTPPAGMGGSSGVVTRTVDGTAVGIVTPTPNDFMKFGTAIGGKLEKRFEAIGAAIADAVDVAFNDGMSRTFRVASVMLLIGALLALLLKSGRNVAGTQPAEDALPPAAH